MTRGGMDLSEGARFPVSSVYDLIGVSVNAEIDGRMTTLESPWSDDPSEMQAYLPDLLDRVTTSSSTAIVGRININEARYEVLIGIPGMTEDLAAGIVDSQMIGPDGEPLEDVMDLHATPAWPYFEGLMDLAELRDFAPYITTGGDVFRAQVVGHDATGTTVVRWEALIDASVVPAKVLMARELAGLGRGYSPTQLGLMTQVSP